MRQTLTHHDLPPYLQLPGSRQRCRPSYLPLLQWPSPGEGEIVGTLAGGIGVVAGEIVTVAVAGEIAAAGEIVAAVGGEIVEIVGTVAGGIRVVTGEIVIVGRAVAGEIVVVPT